MAGEEAAGEDGDKQEGQRWCHLCLLRTETTLRRILGKKKEKK